MVDAANGSDFSFERSLAHLDRDELSATSQRWALAHGKCVPACRRLHAHRFLRIVRSRFRSALFRADGRVNDGFEHHSLPIHNPSVAIPTE